jgi:hypothetical protein
MFGCNQNNPLNLTVQASYGKPYYINLSNNHLPIAKPTLLPIGVSTLYVIPGNFTLLSVAPPQGAFKFVNANSINVPSLQDGEKQII